MTDGLALRPIRGLALCAGAGGLELGLRLALGERYRAVGYVERDAFAAALLVARMADEAMDRAPVWDDLATFDGGAWRGVVDLVSAGFPCPPYSCAGKRRGAHDPRDLWPEVARVVREVEPGLVFLENVRGSLRHADGLARWLGDLADLGFDAEWGVLGARDVGAPHRRDRLYVLAWRVPDASEHAVRPQPGRREPRGAGSPRPRDDREGLGDTDGDDGWAEPDAAQVPANRGRGLADAERGGCARERRSGLLDGERPARGHDVDGRDGALWPPGPGDAAAWALLPPEAQPALRRGADGLADRVDELLEHRRDRLRVLGNGVVPLAAAHALRVLAARAGFADLVIPYLQPSGAMSSSAGRAAGH